MFITFEGIDGSGKSTQIQLLRERLEREGRRVTVFREPGGTDVSEEVRTLLLNSDYDIDPVTELLLFSAARSQLMEEKVLPLLSKGEIVILDRFYDSTTAYQGYGRECMSLEEIDRLNAIASHHTEPDLTIYLQISLDEARERTDGDPKDRMERSGDAFFRKVKEGFDRLSRQHERIIPVDATLGPREIHKKIWELVEKGFKNISD